MSNNKSKLTSLLKRVDWKTTIIAVLLVANMAMNFYLVRSIVTLHAFTMQFVSDVFYYIPSDTEATGEDVSEDSSVTESETGLDVTEEVVSGE